MIASRDYNTLPAKQKCEFCSVYFFFNYKICVNLVNTDSTKLHYAVMLCTYSAAFIFLKITATNMLYCAYKGGAVEIPFFLSY